MADFTKTADVVLLTHQVVTHPNTVLGGIQTVTDELGVSIVMYHGFVEAVENTNPGSFLVQASPSSTGNEDWVTVAPFTVTDSTPDTEAFTASEPAAETVLAVASTTGFVAEDELYLQDAGTLADSEWARCQEFVTNTSINIIDGLTNAKDSSDFIFNDAQKFSFYLELDGWTRYRVVFQHEGAAGADVHVKALGTTTVNIV